MGYRDDYLTWGIDSSTGARKHIDDAARGQGCDCHCEGCGAPLVAKKGAIRVSHFAHASGYEPCGYTPETKVHLLAKAIIEEESAIWLPGLKIYINKKDGRGTAKKVEIPIHREGVFPLYEVRSETRVGDLQPDIYAVCNFEPIFIEFAVSHFCSHEKVKKVKKSRVSTVEIDLSAVPQDISKEGLRKRIMSGQTGPRSRWIFHPGEALVRAREKQDEEPASKLRQGKADARSRRGKADARINWLYCNHCHSALRIESQFWIDEMECPKCRWRIVDPAANLPHVRWQGLSAQTGSVFTSSLAPPAPVRTGSGRS